MKIGKGKVLGVTVALAMLASGTATAGGFEKYYDYPHAFVGVDALYMEGSGNFAGEEKYSGPGGRVRLGISASKYFGLEVHGAIGGEDEDHDFDNLVGFMARVNIPIGDDINFFGLGGYTEVKASHAEPGWKERNFRAKGGSYGAGLEIKLLEKTSINLDVMRYLDDTDYRLDTGSIGLTFRF